MADEKRRLIYELLVEAKGLADGTKQARTQVTDMTRVVGIAKNALGGMFAGFTVVGVVRGLIQVNDEITRITAQLKVFSIEGAAATQAINAMQDTAVATGSSLQSIANAYKDVADVSETLGLSQKDVADLVDASTRAMVAQGGTAEQAAQQMSTLAFAVEKGNLSQKELKTLLKENDVLQRAFEIALGKTTAEILDQAKASGISASELKKVLDVYRELGKQTEVAPTMERVTTSLTESAKAFTSAFSAASGLSAVLKELGQTVMPENAEASRDWGEKLGNAFAAMLPQAVRLNVEMTKYLAAQREARELALKNWRERDLATQAAFAPAPISAAERRENMGIPTSREEMAELDAGDGAGSWSAWMADLKAHSDQLRSSITAGNLREIVLRTNREVREVQVEITAEQWKQREIVIDIIDAEEARAMAEQLRLDAINQQAEKMEQIRQDMKQPVLPTESIIEATEAAQVLAHAMTGIFTGATHNARDFFRTVLQGLAEVAMQKAILGAVGNAGSENEAASGIIGWLAKAFTTTAARGAVFNAGQVVPMASGGIVSSPTAFPLAGGRVGLMGEAGAEAVMPLRRSSSGRLGVEGTVPRVILNNQTGVAAQAEVIGSSQRLEITLRAAQLGRDMAVAEVNRSIRNGYGVTANSLARSYGLRRRV